MAIICIIVVLFFLLKNSADEQEREERRVNIKINAAKKDAFVFRVKNVKLEDEIIKSLESSYSMDCELIKELSSIYEEIGIIDRNPLRWRKFKDEAIILLMANRGYLPKYVVDIYERYCNPDMLDAKQFRKNSHLVVVWVKNRLKDFGIHENIYASMSALGDPPLYKVDSEAYNYLVSIGATFLGYIWEPILTSYDIKNVIEYRDEISNKTLGSYNMYDI